ncbi:MAG TPA: NAD(+)/NADH kinase [Thermoplasmata archaeon]|nr:NAD(+)/NADH kinase [Thermoplasmata archaeon]
MRLVLLASKDAVTKRYAAEATRTLRERFPEVSVSPDPGPPAPDVLLVLGDDRFLLHALRRVGSQTAILTAGHGFLAEVPPEQVGWALETLLDGQHWIEERLRLDVRMEGRRLPPALNEAALSTSRGAGFLRYTLEVDGEQVWRDSGDGVIVCTPTGSTGYGLSAGGPVVMENAEAIVVVPVCSSTGQRPLVLPARSVVAITEIESRLGRDLVLDGQERIRVRSKGFSIQASADPARFVRFGKARYLQVFGKLDARHRATELPARAPPSVRFLFRLLEDEGAMTEKRLIAESRMPERTVRNAVSYLVRAGLVRRDPSLRDARETVFTLRH